MQHLYSSPKGKTVFLRLATTCQAPVRFFAYHRIKPHAPPLVRAPVNSFEFSTLRSYSPGGALNALTAARKGSILPHLVPIVYG